MSKLRYATSIIITRGAGEDLEILLVERSPRLHFFGGYWAFPGGVADDLDRSAADDSAVATSLRCALRELTKETGLVLDGMAAEPSAVRELVARLPEDPLAARRWRDVVERSAAAFARVRHVCSITTPPFMPIRYATEFVHIALSGGQEPTFDAQKIIQGRFVKPAAALASWTRGERLIVPPVPFLLELLAQYGAGAFARHAAAAAATFAAGALQPIRFTPGILMAPLASPTLLPATTTNCLIVGTDRLYVVDPAPYEHDARRQLFDKLDELRAAGARLCGILVTHHHRDHIGAVAELSRRYDMPVRAHALTYERLPDGDFVRGAALDEGDRIDLGTAPDGTPGWHLEVLHTPGHAVDHLCYMDSRYGAAIVGDMLSTVSTILIDPPEGHMSTYLASLERLLEQRVTTLYPAHGPAHRKGHALVRHYLNHRRQREKMIVEALTSAPQTLAELLPKAYGDTPPEASGVARRALYGGLLKLAEDGRAQETRSGWIGVGS